MPRATPKTRRPTFQASAELAVLIEAYRTADDADDAAFDAKERAEGELNRALAARDPIAVEAVKATVEPPAILVVPPDENAAIRVTFEYKANEPRVIDFPQEPRVLQTPYAVGEHFRGTDRMAEAHDALRAFLAKQEEALRALDTPEIKAARRAFERARRDLQAATRRMNAAYDALWSYEPATLQDRLALAEFLLADACRGTVSRRGVVKAGVLEAHEAERLLTLLMQGLLAGTREQPAVDEDVLANARPEDKEPDALPFDVEAATATLKAAGVDVWEHGFAFPKGLSRDGEAALEALTAEQKERIIDHYAAHYCQARAKGPVLTYVAEPATEQA